MSMFLQIRCHSFVFWIACIVAFIQFLFSNYLCLVAYAACAFSGGCNHSSFTLFLCCLQVVVSMRWPYFQCWQILFIVFWEYTGHFRSFLRCNALCFVMNFLVLWSISSTSSLVHLMNHPEHLTMWTAHVFTLWWEFSHIVWFRVVLLLSWRILLYFFFHLRMFDGVRFQFRKYLYFSFPRGFWFFFLIWLFYSFCHLSFSAFNY